MQIFKPISDNHRIYTIQMQCIDHAVIFMVIHVYFCMK